MVGKSLKVPAHRVFAGETKMSRDCCLLAIVRCEIPKQKKLSAESQRTKLDAVVMDIFII